MSRDVVYFRLRNPKMSNVDIAEALGVQNSPGGVPEPDHVFWQEVGEPNERECVGMRVAPDMIAIRAWLTYFHEKAASFADRADS